jgi:hypothetical protein
MGIVSVNFSFVIFIILWFIAVGALFKVASSKHLHSGDDFETRRLYFAAVVLSGLGLIFIFATALYFLSTNESTAGKEIFDAAKTIIPPIITLVLGYYFGQDKDQSSPNKKTLESIPENISDDKKST